jgi:hypothetical protein
MDGAIDTPNETLTFNPGASDLANGKAVWMGTAQYPIAQPSIVIPLLTRFTITARDANEHCRLRALSPPPGYGDGATGPCDGKLLGEPAV